MEMDKNLKLKSATQKQWKSFKLKVTSTKQMEEDGNFEFEGYASVFNGVDSDNDTIKPAAFSEDIEENGNNRPALWQHNTREPIGVFEVREDNVGLFVKGKLPLDDEFVKGRVIPQLKIGSVTGMSIGFFLVEWKFDEDQGGFIIYKIKLMEISLVTFPADDRARINDLKAAEFACKWDKSHAEKEITDPGYKIGGQLIVDKIKGEIQIVPKALFAARIKLAKANPTESEKNQINEVYNKLNLDEPFSDGSRISVVELKNLSEDDRAWAIKNLPLSAEASNFLAGLVRENHEEPQPESKEKSNDREKVFGHGLKKYLDSLKT